MKVVKVLLVIAMTVFLAGNISGWIAGGGDATCNTITCLLNDDTGYLFTNLNFSGTTGFDDGVDNTGAFTPGVSINVTHLNATGSITLSGLVSCNTIDTDANGVLSCGTDATGGSGSAKTADGIYLYNDSTKMYYNITKANTQFYNKTSYTFVDNCSVSNSCVTILYETELDELGELNTQLTSNLQDFNTLTDQYLCMFDDGSGYIECNYAQRTHLDNFSNTIGFFNDLGNFTANLIDTQVCTYDGDGSQIKCNTDTSAWDKDSTNDITLTQIDNNTIIRDQNVTWITNNQELIQNCSQNQACDNVIYTTDQLGNTTTEIKGIFGSSNNISFDSSTGQFGLNLSCSSYTGSADLCDGSDADTQYLNTSFDLSLIPTTSDVSITGYNLTVKCLLFDSGGKICSG